MRHLCSALLMVLPLCVALHGTPLEAEKGRAAFEDGRKHFGQPLRVPEDHSMARRTEYRNRIESQLFDLSRQIHELNEMVRPIEAKLPAELRAKIASLKAREAIVKEKLTELRSSTSRDWHHVKSELDKALDDLKVALDSARFQFMGFGK